MTPLHTQGEEAPAQREPLLVRVEEARAVEAAARARRRDDRRAQGDQAVITGAGKLAPRTVQYVRSI
jgi:hypothetical protein